MLVAHGVCHVAHHIGGNQVERVRRAVGERLPERVEELVRLGRAGSASPGTEHGNRFLGRPDRKPGRGVAIVQRQLSPKKHVKFREKYGLPFTLLSDEPHEVAELYGTWVEKSMYGKKG